jgi:putative ABC transport system permease protein
MDTLLHDVRFGARMLRKSPGLTATAIFALALGVGVNTAIFSVVDAVLLRPLPYAEPGRLVSVAGTNARRPGEPLPVSYPNFADWRGQATAFERLAAYDPTDFNLVAGGRPERVKGAVVTSDLFALLGAGPQLGRQFTAEEDVPGAAPAVILSHGLWQRQFGGDPAAVGRALPVGGRPANIVGVMPSGFAFPPGAEPAELWAPMSFNETYIAERNMHNLGVVGRLAAGATVEQARAEMEAVAARLAEQYPASNGGWGARVVPLQEHLVGNVRPALLMLLGAVAFVLLIACANVANLLLARASSRRKEMAVRAALGAGRWRVARGLLVESVMLALAAGALGLLLAFWGTDLLVALGPGDLPRIGEVALDERVLLFTLAVSLLTGVGFGLAPAAQASRADLVDALKEGGSNPSARPGGRLRGALVVSEIALALVLLVGAGLLVRSFARLLEVDPGFRPEGVVTMQLQLSDASYAENHQVVSFYDRLLERARGLPGVVEAGLVTTVPLGKGAMALTYDVEGRPPAPPNERTSASFDVASPGYFRAMNIPLVRGRTFTDADREGSPAVVIVSETMARRAWPGEDPLGKRITMGASASGPPPPSREVVGVVGDVKHGGLEAEVKEAIYAPYGQVPWPNVTLVARTEADPDATAVAMRAAVRGVSPDQPVYNVRVMEQVVAESVAKPRLYASLLGLFAGLALLLSAMGIYAVMSYTVTQRAHEIGIRMALGARPGDVLRLVVGHGMRLTLVGVAIGLAAAFGLARLLASLSASLLFGVSATDPATFGGIALLLAGVALLACWLPARRAARVDPLVALRTD